MKYPIHCIAYLHTKYVHHIRSISNLHILSKGMDDLAGLVMGNYTMVPWTELLIILYLKINISFFFYYYYYYTFNILVFI